MRIDGARRAIRERLQAKAAPELLVKSDEELFQLVAGGNEHAFRLLWDRFGTAVYSLCLRYLGDPQAAEDAAQEAFTAVWRRASTFDPDRGSAAAWLSTVARNAASQVARGTRRREAILAVLPEQGAAHEDEIVMRLAVHSALTRIPHDERVVLELAYFDDLSQTQIAARLRLPLGTVKSRTRSGLRRLAEYLGGAWT